MTMPFDCHFAQRSAGRATLGRPLMQAPAPVRWACQSLLSWMVRAVGIEPTLLAERDFESDETTLVHRRNQRSKNNPLPDVRERDGNQPIFKPKCVRVCVNEAQAKAWQELVAACKNADVPTSPRFRLLIEGVRIAPLWVRQRRSGDNCGEDAGKGVLEARRTFLLHPLGRYPDQERQRRIGKPAQTLASNGHQRCGVSV